ncbi:hypothetical protein BH09VER1_BH09VER1_46040 [soil metagenome]
MIKARQLLGFASAILFLGITQLFSQENILKITLDSSGDRSFYEVNGEVVNNFGTIDFRALEQAKLPFTALQIGRGSILNIYLPSVNRRKTYDLITRLVASGPFMYWDRNDVRFVFYRGGALLPYHTLTCRFKDYIEKYSRSEMKLDDIDLGTGSMALEKLSRYPFEKLFILRVCIYYRNFGDFDYENPLDEIPGSRSSDEPSFPFPEEPVGPYLIFSLRPDLPE